MKNAFTILPRLPWSSPLYSRKVCGWQGGSRPEEAGNQPFFQHGGGFLGRALRWTDGVGEIMMGMGMGMGREASWSTKGRPASLIGKGRTIKD